MNLRRFKAGSRLVVIVVLAQAVLWTACEKEATPRLADDELADFMLGLTANDTAVFRYDSLTYDPIVGGTARRQASGRWIVTADDTDSTPDDTRERYVVRVVDSLGAPRSSFAWVWNLLADSSGITHTTDNIAYLALTRPLRVGSRWDALICTDADLEIAVEGEPLQIHRNWAARIDSLGDYALPDGRRVEAVWVTHADSENQIELRQVREVYGRGIGLLRREVKIIDTQNLGSTPIEERAERGFTFHLERER